MNFWGKKNIKQHPSVYFHVRADHKVQEQKKVASSAFIVLHQTITHRGGP